MPAEDHQYPAARACPVAPALPALVLLALVGAAVSLQAAREPHRATHAFTVVASATPRVMVSGADARDVKITLSNDGTTRWDAAAGYALSYHWRTPFDTMVQRDGTRTPLPSSVAPGGVITLTAELGPPPRAGLYVLEWDMVQEGVTWFSERDRAPLARTLVVVLPSAGFVVSSFRAVPSLVAAFGLLLVWRARRWTPGRDGLARRAGPVTALAAVLLPGWDLVWCASSLLFKQLGLVSAAHLHVTATGFVMSVLLAALPPLLLLFVNESSRPRLAWLVAAGGSLVLLADAVYYRFFGDLLSVAALSAGSQAGHLAASVRSLLLPEDVWLALDLLLALLLVPRLAALQRPPARWPRRAVAVSGLVVIALAAVPSPVAIAPVGSESEAVFRHLNVAERFGVGGYHLDDAVRYVKSRLLRPSLTGREMADARAWFAAHSRERAGSGPYFGAARGHSLVFILVESLQGFVVDSEGQRPGDHSESQSIAPRVSLVGRPRGPGGRGPHVGRRAAQRSVPPAAVSRRRRLPVPGQPLRVDARPVGAARLLHVLGGALRRQLLEPQRDAPRVRLRAQLLRARFRARRGGRLGAERPELPAADARRACGAAPRPYCAWLITLSLHHPFDSFPDDLKFLDLGRWNGTHLGNYLHAMHLFDLGLGELVTGLRQDGLLDDTLLVVEGDHEAGAPWQEVAQAAGLRADTLNWYLADRVPLVIRIPGTQAPKGELRMVAGQADVAPTLLALLGVDPAPLPFIGRNLLGTPGDGPVVRRYGDWVDSRHLYLAGQGYTSRQACFDVASRGEVPLTACRAAQAEAVGQLEVSNRVLTHGLQQQFLVSAGARR